MQLIVSRMEVNAWHRAHIISQLATLYSKYAFLHVAYITTTLLEKSVFHHVLHTSMDKYALHNAQRNNSTTFMIK